MCQHFSRQRGPLSQLQIKLHSLSVDQDDPIVHKLLSRAVVGLIAAKRFKMEEELDGDSLWRGYTRARAESHSGAETNTVKVLVAGKISESATNKRRDVLVEGQGSKLIARGVWRLDQRSGQG